jgi:hypothetical protein
MAKAEPKKAEAQPELEMALTGQLGNVGLLGEAGIGKRSLSGTLNGGGPRGRVHASGGYVSLRSYQFFRFGRGELCPGKGLGQDCKIAPRAAGGTLWSSCN